MDARQLSPDVAVSPQITAADVPAIAAAGYRSIICNRPDREAGDQPDHDGIEAAAKAAGLAFVYQPVVSSMLNEADAAAFGRHVAELPKPVFAYCRSGARCANLFALMPK